MRSITDKIKASGLIESGDRILVGLSGGADSMCLTHALYKLSGEIGFEVFTAHVNHNIRGEAAEHDEIAAREFAQGLGIKHFSESIDVPAFAEKESISEELAGRQLRYAFFERLIKENRFNKIATAHNKNDNAETILMNFMRGSSINGLCGIPQKRGNIIRPILDVSREDIERYCKEYSLPYVTDGTNAEQVYTRNKVRLNLIPKISREFNSNIINTLTRNASIIKDDCDFLEREAQRLYDENIDGYCIKTEFMTKLHPSMRRRIIIKMLFAAMGDIHDMSSDYIEKISELCVNAKTGKSLDLMNNVKARIVYDRLYIEKSIAEAEAFDYKLEMGSETVINAIGMSIKMCGTDNAENGIILCGDTDNVHIRSRKNGDIFYPVGMRGKKKLKDFFIDEKIPRDMRMRIGIVTIGGEIAYISGKRADRRFVCRQSDKDGFKIIMKKI